MCCFNHLNYFVLTCIPIFLINELIIYVLEKLCINLSVNRLRYSLIYIPNYLHFDVRRFLANIILLVQVQIIRTFY